MPTKISPMLAVSDGPAAVEFYANAFDAKLLWQLGDAHIVAGLEIDGAEFFLAHQSPNYGTKSPANLGHTTVRIELFVDDPVAVQKKAIAAGATEHSPVTEDQFETHGPRPLSRILQGAVTDPFGHIWLIGKILD